MGEERKRASHKWGLTYYFRNIQRNSVGFLFYTDGSSGSLAFAPHSLHSGCLIFPV